MSVIVPFFDPHLVIMQYQSYYLYIMHTLYYFMCLLFYCYVILYYVILYFITDCIHNGSLGTSQIVNVHGTLVKFALEAEAGVFATSQVPLRTSDFG